MSVFIVFEERAVTDPEIVYINKIKFSDRKVVYSEIIYKHPFREAVMEVNENFEVYSSVRPSELFVFKIITGKGKQADKALQALLDWLNSLPEAKQEEILDSEEFNIIDEITKNLKLTKTMAHDLIKKSERKKVRDGQLIDSLCKFRDLSSHSTSDRAYFYAQMQSELDMVNYEQTQNRAEPDNTGSTPSLLTGLYSHIYMEKEAVSYPVTQNILRKLSKSVVIEIEHYKDVFNRGGQDFYSKKQNPKLILAVKKERFYYKGSPFCNNYSFEHFYYTSQMMNCPYHCHYCYLQGMYPSADIVIFVNIEDSLRAVENLESQKPLICISYDTDMPAMEKLTGFVSAWLDFCRKHKGITIEVRTKSAGFGNIIKNTQHPTQADSNVILAYTLSPEEVRRKYEKRVPPLDVRIGDINLALTAGYRVRICLDPLLYIENYPQIYTQFIDYVCGKINMEKITDISCGVFRIPKDYLRRMEKRKLTVITAYPFIEKDQRMTYSEAHAESLLACVKEALLKYVPEEKMIIW